MRVVFIQTKNGLLALTCRCMKSIAAAVVSSSIVSMRFLVSGPVSSMVCLPTLPKRGSTVGSSRSLALLLITPRGPNLAVNAGSLRVVRIFRVFLGIEMIEIAEELIEAVHCRQKFVAIAEMVLAELAGGIAERLERLGDGDVFGLQSDRGAGNADLGETRAQYRLTGDERRTPSRAALLGVIVREHHAFFGDAVDVRRAVTHEAECIGADVGLADVVAEDHEDVLPLARRRRRLCCCACAI